jgi:two-component system, cell cycle response regulator DivK
VIFFLRAKTINLVKVTRASLRSSAVKPLEESFVQLIVMDKAMNLNILANSIQTSINEKSLILAVDSNEDNLILITYFLESFACQLITAKNGEEALFLATKYLPNLILLEIVLPDINGLEVVAKLKQNELTSQIPIIAVTGLVKIGDREQILRSGCDAYLGKPYLLNDLANVISNLL